MPMQPGARVGGARCSKLPSNDEDDVCGQGPPVPPGVLVAARMRIRVLGEKATSLQRDRLAAGLSWSGKALVQPFDGELGTGTLLTAVGARMFVDRVAAQGPRSAALFEIGSTVVFVAVWSDMCSHWRAVACSDFGSAERDEDEWATTRRVATRRPKIAVVAQADLAALGAI